MSANSQTAARFVTVTMGLVIGLAFLFGFGNLLNLALKLQVPVFVAPLVAPAVDLTVLGLLVGTRHLALSGASDEVLRPARHLLLAASMVTLLLNVADPVFAGQWGKAAFDCVGPLLLIGWAEAGPGLLRALSAAPAEPGSEHLVSPSAAKPKSGGAEQEVVGSMSLPRGQQVGAAHLRVDDLDRGLVVRAHVADAEHGHDELQRARVTFHQLLVAATAEELRRPTRGTRWTNERLLFHMLFGYLVVRVLLVLVRVMACLPVSARRGFARVLDAATRPFDVVSFWGSRGGARVFNHRRMGRVFDVVVRSLQRRLDAETEQNLRRGMYFPPRWDPFLSEFMALEDVYRFPTKHFDFHAKQLTFPER